MPSKETIQGGYLLDANGSPIERVKTGNDKNYAVILKCGHCGAGYFIPIMFTVASKDIQSAVKSAKLLGRVQRDRSDCVLGAFEITPHERTFIESINDRDPYLRGMIGKDDDQIVDRRVYHEITDSRDSGKDHRNWSGIKTAEDYNPYYALERIFAPRYERGRWVTPNRVNKDEILDEFFLQNTLRFGIRKGQSYVLALYYQEYGKDNILGVEYDNGYIHFQSDGKKRTVAVSDNQEKRMKAFITKENEALQKKKLEEESLRGQTQDELSASKAPSRIDRFNARFNKTMQMGQSTKPQVKPQEESGGYCPGE